MATGQDSPVGAYDHLVAEKALAGPGAAALKYDLLSALLVTSTCGDPVTARLALRLSLLITARYDWRQRMFAVGLRELARMWGVTERTAKREMAAMRARDWIEVHVPAARGRVASYRLRLDRILRETMPHWPAIGPDFAARMTGGAGEAAPDNVVPLHPQTPDLPAPDGFGWAEAAAQLRAADAATFTAWFAPLRPFELDAGLLTLTAPSAFAARYVTQHHKTRLLAAVCAVNREVRDLAVVAVGKV